MTGRNWVVVGIICIILSACGGNGGDSSAGLPTRITLNDDGTPTAEQSASVAEMPLSTQTTGDNPILNFWEPVNGEIPADTLGDSWRFIAQPGDSVRVRALSETVTMTLTLFDPNNLQLAQGDSVEAMLNTGGIFRVDVQGDQAGAYQLGLSYTDRPNPTALVTAVPEIVGVPTPTPPFTGLGSFIAQIDDEETLGGELSADDPSHIYTFTATMGDYVQVELNRVSGEVDPALTLYDPNGNAMAFDDDSNGEVGAILRNILLPEDGIYSIRAQSDGLDGAYAVRLLVYDVPAPITPTTAPTPTLTPTFSLVNPTPEPAVRNNRLESHVPVLDELEAGGDLAIFPFVASEGEILTIAVVPTDDSPIRPRVEVIDPEGQVIAASTASISPDNNNAIILNNIQAGFDGTYQVFVSGEDESAGAFVIGYGSGNTWQNNIQGPIGADAVSEGNIALRGTRDVWYIAMGAGDILSAAVSTSQGSVIDPILELVPVDNPDTIIAIDDNSGGGLNALLNRISITETSIYMLRVSASRGETVGGYTLIWRYVNRAPTATPIPAVAFVLSAQDDVAVGEYNFYPFQGREGQRVQIRVIAEDGSPLDPVAALIDPDGEVIVEVDDSGDDLNARFIAELPADGTYNVRVNGYIDGGRYEVVVEEIFR